MKINARMIVQTIPIEQSINIGNIHVSFQGNKTVDNEWFRRSLSKKSDGLSRIFNDDIDQISVN